MSIASDASGDSDDGGSQYGHLEVVLRHASNLKEVETLGTQDPYCVLRVGLFEQRSKTHTDGGKNPVWNQDFQFSRVPRNEVLFIQIMDSNVVTADEVIGEVWVQLADLVVDEYFNTTATDLQVIRVLPVKRNGKQYGDLHVSLSMGPATDEAEDSTQFNSHSVPTVVVVPLALLVAFVVIRTLSWKAILFIGCAIFLYLVPVPSLKNRRETT